ncbi:MAG: DUF2914 domain-containing protein [candidate division Zixibacteria bacterium]|nr:DUF2914 domain-containing protein [candidate division Zixibacteria bacterium]
MKMAGRVLILCFLTFALLSMSAYAQDVEKTKTNKTATEKTNAVKTSTTETATTTAKTKTTTETAEDEFKVEKLACGIAVEERELQGEATVFPANVERIYCWSLITGCLEPTTVEHIWYYGGEEKARVSLDIKYPRVRTWSYKTILPEWKGDWKVEVVDEDGKILATSLIKVE